jgi:serine protease AprX
MNTLKKSPSIATFISLGLILACLCVPTMRFGNVQAQSGHRSPQAERLEREDDSIDLSGYLSTNLARVSPDLREQLDRQSSSGDFRTMDAKGAGASDKDSRVTALVQFKQQPGNGLSSFLSAGNVVQKGQYVNFNTKLVELPLSAVRSLAAFREVDYISLDRSVEMHGHVEITSGAFAMRQTSGNSTINGNGICIAVLDSGIYKDHDAFKAGIVANVDFTGGSGTQSDPYGHGTHVAALAAGDRGLSQGAYAGIAPGAKLANLRVLDSQGRGTTSAVLSALDWVMTNRTRYNIRVVNMSLGALAIDSYVTDPLCRAVRRLVEPRQ